MKLNFTMKNTLLPTMKGSTDHLEWRTKRKREKGNKHRTKSAIIGNKNKVTLKQGQKIN